MAMSIYRPIILTNILVMLVFASVNIALLVLRRRHARAAVEGGSVGFRVPLVVPLLGVLASLALFVFGVAERLELISPV